MVDYGYRDNNRILAAMHKIFADSLCVSRIDSVCIQAFSSPEGDADYNRRLALRRAQAVKGYLVWKYPGHAPALPGRNIANIKAEYRRKTERGSLEEAEYRYSVSAYKPMDFA